MAKVKYEFVYVVKVLAIILITNSHFKQIYEGSLSQLAFGGALGCSLFFFCSGFTSTLGKNRPFLSYIWHKLIRLYPTVWIFLLCTGETPSIDSYILLQQFWFLQALIIFYVVHYFIVKYINKNWILFLLICSLMIATVTSYIQTPLSGWIIDYPRLCQITWPYYYSMMLLGVLLSRVNPDSFQKYYIKSNILRIIIVLASIALVYELKFIIQKGYISCDAQILFPFILLLACYIVYFALFKMTRTHALVKWFAALTLEIYIVQIICIRVCSSISFPLRLLLVVLIIIASAWLLQIVQQLTFKGITIIYNHLKPTSLEK